MRNYNGYGSVVKLSGNRRKPYACRKTLGFNDKGYPIYKYISYHATKREADKALKEYNENPYELDRKTFKQIYEIWLPKQNYSPEVERKYKNAYDRCSDLQGLYMNELTLSRLQLFFDGLKATKQCTKNVKTLIKHLFDYCIKRGILPISSKEILPLIEFSCVEASRKVERVVFTEKEIKKLWKLKDNLYCHIMLFYLYTGLRYSELKNAEWHIKEKYISIKKAKTAAGIRDVPLSDKALSLLPLPELPQYKTYHKGMKEIFPDHSPHDTRHTFISLMTQAEVDPRILKKIVGHATNDVTENVYTHISIDKMLEAVNKI